jgi:hypothetical protein
MLKHFLIFLLFGSFSTSTFAENRPVDYSNLSIEELMNIKINVVSAISSNQSESPGAVTVFTAADILASGASQISELIEQVPGISESKILYMINNIPLNDLGHSGIQITDNIPLSMIERIEIFGLSELTIISIETGDYSVSLKFRRRSFKVNAFYNNYVLKYEQVG